MSNVLFDQMSTSEVQEIMLANLPEDIVDATPEYVMELRERAMSTGRQQRPVYVRLDLASLDALFGFRLAKEGEIPRFFRENRKEKWVADWNQSNRPISDPGLKKLFRAMISDRFVTSPETFIFLDDGMCGSAQHRGWTMRETMLARPDYRPVVCLAFGFSAKLADVLDQQTKRQNKDIAARNELIPDELVEDLADPSKAQSTLSRELNQMAKIVWHRSQGRDISASGEFDQTEFGQMLNRLPGYADFLAHVYRLGKQADGVADSHGVKLFGRATIAALLILAANADQVVDWQIDGRKRVFDLPTRIDMPSDEFVEGFMSVLNDDRAGSPFGSFYRAWTRATNKHPQRKVGFLTALIEHYLSTRSEHVVEPEIDATTGQPLPGAEPVTTWTCDMVTEDMISRIDPGSPEKRKPGGETPPSYVWNAFGGLDCGYLGKVTSVG